MKIYLLNQAESLLLLGGWILINYMKGAPMPYIKQPDRSKFHIQVPDINTAGELNYFLTLICLSYLDDKKLSYTTLNEIVGVLECMKLEFYRRAAIPYEDNKIKENGDVY